MQRSRRAVKRAPKVETSSDSEDEIPLKKLHASQQKKKVSDAEDSSSESDIENYLQPIDKLDLNSSFFNTKKNAEQEFNKIEKDIFAGVTRLSDSDSDEEMNETNTVQESTQKFSQTDIVKPSTSATAMKLNFKQLEDYTKKIEEAKKHVEEYNAKKKAEEHNVDISNLLAAGETKNLTLENIKPEDLHSSDFESCDSEQEDWEEVKIKESQEVKEKSLVPKDGVQITVNMPDTCRKKKGVDLLAAMKRRLNRIRKENQVYVHKVHLLCWIAHGNYVNETINNTQVLGLALSLLPSDKCYPSDRTDLSYLEQIVQWYKRTIKVSEKLVPKDLTLVNALQLQINRKEVYNKKMLVYIFVAILRSLGIQCRLVLSFQVEPLRPPASELHSLANDAIKKRSKASDKAKKTPSKVTEKKSDNKPSDKQEKSGTNKKDSMDKTDNKNDKIEADENGKSQKNKNTKKKQESEKKETKKPEVEEKELENKNRTTRIRSRNNTRTNVANLDKALDKKEGPQKKESNGISKKGKSTNAKTTTDKKTAESKDKEKKTKRTNQGKSETASSNTLKVQDGKNTRSKSAETKTKSETSKKKETLTVDNAKSRRSKSEDTAQEKRTRSKTAAKKDIIKVKLPKKEKVAQLDGTNISSEDDTSFYSVFPSGIPQVDGADDEKPKKGAKTKKPNLKKLTTPAENKCEKKAHPSRLKTAVDDYNSENEFKPRSPFTNKNKGSPKEASNRKVNLHKLKTKDNVPPVNSPPKKQLDIKDDIVNLIKGRIVEQKHVDRSRMVKKRKPSYKDDSDSDYMPEPIKKKHHESDSELEYFVPKPKVKQRISFRKIKEQKVLSSDSETEKSDKKKKKGVNVWVEVFLENEEKWISVDLVYGQVHCVNELYNRATHPVTYIVAWSNDNYLKDITMRYCKSFNTVTRKLRVDAKWWEESLMPFRAAYTAREKEEDDDLNRQQLDQPMPKAISE